MPKHNLNALGHEEFERLCQSLVQRIIGPGAKVYGMGNDGAREATFHGKAPYPSRKEQWDGKWIFQAKFHDVQQIGPRKARRRLLTELDNELSVVVEKYKYACDNFVLMTNVSLTPAFQKGVKDRIDNVIVPKYHNTIKHIHVWGAEEICRFLDRFPNIRRTYAHLLLSSDIIASLMGLVEREETDLDELVKLYTQGCHDHKKYVALDDAGDIEEKPVELHRVFTDLDVKPSSLPRSEHASEKLPEWLKQATEDDDRTRALSYLLDDSLRQLVLVGGPGEGKSTLGQYIALIHRARIIGNLPGLGESAQELEKCIPRIPFNILLRDYAQWISSRDSSGSIFHYLAEEISKEAGRDATPLDIHNIIKANPVLLILDGLDEVPEKTLRRRVLDNITSFLSQTRNILRGDLRVIATTRPYGYTEEFDPNHYLHLTLQKLSGKKVTTYAEKWTSTREPRPKERERILNALNTCLSDKIIRGLTQTPLQVTILLVIIRARGTPPKQREELFQKYMDIVYLREQKKRPELLKTGKDVIYGLHKYLAYILHKRAEKDRTAALMDVSEFEERVTEYLANNDPLLKKEELESNAKQIIREASTRLVLIESPQLGKVGFGLTTTREFFAAAHLVDTAKDSDERALRFRAIARSPHWRNAALFFAGRVGRTLPGEAPNLIDVCRETDTERADRFLKRGAELVMEIVDDHALRQTRSEIGSIQYGLTLLERGFLKDTERFMGQLRNLSGKYKERVIHPWMKQRLESMAPENLSLYIDVYENLFGCDKTLRASIQRASRSDIGNVRLWALTKSLENRIVEKWVIKVLEELVDVLPPHKLVRSFSRCLPDFLRLYLTFPFSDKARAIIARAVLRYWGPDKFPVIEPDSKSKENFLFLWGMYQFSNLSTLWRKSHLGPSSSHLVEVTFPQMAHPNVKSLIRENANHFRDFCETFAKKNELFTEIPVAVFEFLLALLVSREHRNVSKEFERLVNVLRRRKDTEGYRPYFQWIISPIIGQLLEEEENLVDHLRDLIVISQCYESESQYMKDLEALNAIINKRRAREREVYFVSTTATSYSTIKKLLDLELREAQRWLQNRGLTSNILRLCTFKVSSNRSLEPLETFLSVAEKQLAEQEMLGVSPWLWAFYEWHEPKTEREVENSNRLKRILEYVTTNYSSIRNPDISELAFLYLSALAAKIVDQEDLIRLYKICNHDPAFLEFVPFYDDVCKKAQNSLQWLVNLLHNDNMKIVRLAAVSLQGISKWTRRNHERTVLFQERWVGEKFWELSKDRHDLWRRRYIEGMAQCKLGWADKWREIAEAIKEASTNEIQDAWCKVIEKAGCYENEDKDALLNLLLYTLELREVFTRSIRLASLKRLHELISESGSAGFDEKELGLPLSRRF